MIINFKFKYIIKFLLIIIGMYLNIIGIIAMYNLLTHRLKTGNVIDGLGALLLLLELIVLIIFIILLIVNNWEKSIKIKIKL